MKVIVVGAGIAGLSAAIGLRRAGHEVLILDKSSLSNEVGAAIHVQPNASRIVTQWGFDIERARLVTAKSSTLTSGDDLRVLTVIDVSNTEEEYGSRFFYSHRVDLHTELKLLATGEEGQGKPAVIQNKCEVVGYDTINGSLTLADGTSMTADLVVGADGIHSAAVKEVIGYENPAVPTGTSCFRCLIPVKEIQEDPECAFFMEEMEGKLRVFVSPNNSKKRIVWYPCRENQILNVGFMCPDREGLESTEDWTIRIPSEIFHNELIGYHPALRHLLAKGKDVRLWKLLFRAPIPTWHRGKLVLIGDAAHPMLPYQGQAGAQAIEDGCALGILFSNLPPGNPTAETISTRLNSFEKIRRNRASAMQMLSNEGVDQAEEVTESARCFMEEGQSVPLTPKEYQKYIYGHDVAKACEEELERINRIEGVE
ncbi:4b2ebc84-1b8a-41b5-883e-30fb027223f2 [Sclerotinia trifoliorum]|uniref:4b2ebc84-1b8a-41b5-883e-30fb027223f2 n=1 Tax=Sclerotinia trifoliorum TaxID=28548 RepID=A0A8H2ZTC8_9HELO|nr:4b2ebc84-1b8a-41b5-883e-30fb027223f2 [Sclerotinia trifoliorum]